jgi:hypothetical protein
MHRKLKFLVGALGALMLAACGGSTGSAPAVFETAALEGVVVEVDGQTTSLGGIEVRVVETGATVFTAVDGSFTIAGLEPGSYRLAFDAGLPQVAHEKDANAGDGQKERDLEAEREEREDRDGHPVIEVTRACGKITIAVKLENGTVKEFTIGEHAVRHARSKLHRPEGVAFEGFHPVGRISVSAAGADGAERQVFRVKVEGVPGGSVLELFVDLRDEQGPVSVGTAIADGEGEALYVRDTGEGQELPRGVGLGDLAGKRLEVRLMQTDTLILVGEIPHLPNAADHDCGNRDGEGHGEGHGEGEGDKKEEDGDEDKKEDGNAEKGEDDNGDNGDNAENDKDENGEAEGGEGGGSDGDNHEGGEGGEADKYEGEDGDGESNTID